MEEEEVKEILTQTSIKKMKFTAWRQHVEYWVKNQTVKPKATWDSKSQAIEKKHAEPKKIIAENTPNLDLEMGIQT